MTRKHIIGTYFAGSLLHWPIFNVFWGALQWRFCFESFPFFSIKYICCLWICAWEKKKNKRWHWKNISIYKCMRKISGKSCCLKLLMPLVKYLKRAQRQFSEEPLSVRGTGEGRRSRCRKIPCNCGAHPHFEYSFFF